MLAHAQEKPLWMAEVVDFVFFFMIPLSGLLIYRSRGPTILIFFCKIVFKYTCMFNLFWGYTYGDEYIMLCNVCLFVPAKVVVVVEFTCHM